ncbi:hypothetical protein [Aureliella helgolandensis]|nr:hypothetical protein [Aureliella helgolandensis]
MPILRSSLLIVLSVFIVELGGAVANAETLSDRSAISVDPQLLNDAYVASASPGANLNDVAIISEDRLLCIGDRGLILGSKNGGRLWSSLASLTTANLHGVDFDNHEIGIIVGGWIGNYTGTSKAAVLRSLDGGDTWTTVRDVELPSLRGVRFENRRAIAWGDYSPKWKTSVFESLDGGLSWHGLRMPIGHATVAAVDNVGTVVAVDRLGRSAMGVGHADRLDNISDGNRPLQCLTHTGLGWLAGGSAGELIFSRDGKQWQDLALPLSPAAKACCRWASIAQVDDEIWVGGAPGSVLLYSADRGATWSLKSTGHTLPIASLRFLDARRGWAVGALGSILATRDGGKTWYSQRQAAGRLGVLAISATDADTPWLPLIATSWDDQIASASLVLQAGEPIEHANFLPGRASCLESLAPHLGLAQHAHWADLPVSKESATERLAIELLSWKPDVLLTSRESGRGATSPTALALAAIESAAQSERLSVAQELGLKSWPVRKLVEVTDEATSQFTEQSQRVLRTPALSIQDLLQALPPDITQEQSTVAMRSVWTRTHAPAALVSLLGAIPPSADTRMELPIKEIGNYQLVMGRVHRDRAMMRLGDSEGRMASDQQWDEALRVLLAGLPDGEIAPAAYRLTGMLNEPQDWPRRRRVLERLIALQPKSDAADWARLELLTRLGSEEFRAWQASALVTVSEASVEQFVTDSAAPVPIPESRLGGAGERLDRLVGEQVKVDDASAGGTVWDRSPFSDAQRGTSAQLASAPFGSVVRASATSSPAPSVPVNESLEPQAWFGLLDRVHRESPGLRNRPDLALLIERMKDRMPLTAAAQKAALGGEAAFGESSMLEGPLIGWPQVARQELLLRSNQTGQLRWLALAVRADQPPLLDGVLSESFWNQVPALQLTSIASDPASESEQPALIRIAYDSDYLYVAVHCFREQSDGNSSRLKRVRTYDSDLSETDRVELLFDVDRDYSTAIELAISEDGRTCDRCDGVAGFNPKWHVFARPETHEWTAEIAIELSSLTTEKSVMGQAWALSVRRHRPQGNSQSWSQLQTHRSLLQASGLLLFAPPL